jgi:hypothetical protein
MVYTHLIYLSSGDIVVPSQSNIYKTLIVSQIQINLQMPHVSHNSAS